MFSDFFSLLADLPDAAVAAAIGAIGLVVVEIIRQKIAKYNRTSDDRAAQADGLREDIEKLKVSVAKVEEQRDHWRERYFEVKEKLLVLQAAVTVAEIEAEKRRNVRPPDVPEPPGDSGPVS